MRQEGHDHHAVRYVGHDRPPATIRARENVHQINSPWKLGPLDPRGEQISGVKTIVVRTPVASPNVEELVCYLALHGDDELRPVHAPESIAAG